MFNNFKIILKRNNNRNQIKFESKANSNTSHRSIVKEKNVVNDKKYKKLFNFEILLND